MEAVNLARKGEACLEEAGHLDVASMLGSFFDGKGGHGEVAVEGGSLFKGELFAGN